MVDRLEIGSLLEAAEPTPAQVLARKLNRHTFWCGQSGSGKTYALGVLLERVILHTRLPLVILDPNSDFVGLGTVREGVDDAVRAAWDERDIRVFRPGRDRPDALQARFLDMPWSSRAALLELDPIRDAEDFNALVKLEGEMDVIRRGSLVTYLRSGDDPARHRLATRLENLGLGGWGLWAWRGRSVTDDIREQPDATVLDLGGFPTRAEMLAAALAVLDHLWENRADRVGRMIVIDEAHNLVQPNPMTPVERELTERIVQIAAEGRKYGLWLLLSTQRPSKVHPNALSQCDNLALMRMSSPRDLAELGEVFGYAPAALVERSPLFAQGQALFAGGFVETAGLVQMGERLTVEGGSDVAVLIR